MKPAERTARNLDVPHGTLAEFCRRKHIRKLSLFGSVLRNDFAPGSDVDVLVEYEPGHVPGFDFVSHEEELSGILGRKVDLNTPNCLSRYFRQEALAEAEALYVETCGTRNRLAYGCDA